MATVIYMEKNIPEKEAKKKVEGLVNTSSAKKFPASKFTGKMKSFGDGMAYQKAVRDEWK